MSVKIYAGLILRHRDPFDGVAAMRAVLEPLYLTRFAHVVREAEQGAADGRTWAERFGVPASLQERWGIPISTGRGIRSTAFKLVRDLDACLTRTFSSADIAYTVSIVPNGRVGGRALALVHGESDRLYTDALVDAGAVKRYPYWDNSDPEDGLTDEAWARRRESWSTLIAGGAPADVGVAFRSPGEYRTAWQ